MHDKWAEINQTLIKDSKFKPHNKHTLKNIKVRMLE